MGACIRTRFGVLQSRRGSICGRHLQNEEDCQGLQRAKRRGYFAGISDTCENKKLPEIDLNIPPAGGTVCMRPGMTRLHNVWSGGAQHCIGKMMFGAVVIYIPFRSFTGVDTMQYTVRAGVQPSQSKTYEVEITVEAGQATASGASSAAPEPQKAGPMPACPALVS
jgi:hypothetical protein